MRNHHRECVLGNACKVPMLAIQLVCIAVLFLGASLVACAPAAPPLPEGFSHREGSVEDGYVISDEAGNEFVWVPATHAFRYNFSESVELAGDHADDAIERIFYGEGRPQAVTHDTAYDIAAFKSSISKHGGFYIARYEMASPCVSRKGLSPHTFLTRDEALAEANSFYRSSNATSTLASSYAWDMTVRFAYGDNTSEPSAPSEQSASAESAETSTAVSKPARTGESGDLAKNIYDLAGNVSEWTTEYSSNAYYEYHDDCVFRGSSFDDPEKNPTKRMCNSNVANEFTGFRVVIYLT